MKKIHIFCFITLFVIAIVSITAFFWRQINVISVEEREIKLTNLTPQFVYDTEGEGIPLSLELKKIKNYATKVINKGDLSLKAVTPNEILVTIFDSHFGRDVLLDVKTSKISYPNSQTISFQGSPLSSSVFSVKINDTIIYIGQEEIFYYKLGQNAFLPLAGSKLSDIPVVTNDGKVFTPNETYLSTIGDFADSPTETHTDKTITVSVYDSNKTVKIPNTELYRQKKIRELTFNLP